MTIPLRQSTASQEIPLGYFLDSTDGDTEETGLTIANTDIKLWKHGATTLANKNSGGATHISNGLYYAVLDATDTNTLGGLVIFVHVSGALAVKVECTVYPATIYDSMIAGTDYIQTDVIQIGGDTQSGTDLKDFADAGYDPATNKVQGVVLTDTCTTNTDMRGTDSAALAATALTNATWTDARAGYLDELAAANLPTDVAAASIRSAVGLASANLDTQLGDIPTVSEFNARTLASADYVVTTDTIAGVTTVTNLTNAPTSGDLTATMKASINTEVDNALDTAIPGSPTADSINERIKAIDDLTQASGSGDLAAILTDTAEIGAAGAGLTAVPWNGSWDAEVESECTDAINNLTLSEMAQGAPGATPSIPLAINYLYRMWRNKTLCTATELSMWDDAGTTKLVKSTISDDTTTFTKGEFGSGA